MGKMKSMQSLLALTLAGAMMGGDNMFGESHDKPIPFDKLPPEDQQRYLYQLAKKQLANERRLALAKGLKEFVFQFNSATISIYALNTKSAQKKCRNKILELIQQYGKDGLEYPKFKPIPGTDISGVRKAYEIGKISNI